MLEAPLLVLCLLRVNVGLHLLQVEAHRRDSVPTRPEVLPREVPFFARELAGDRDGTLPFENPTIEATAYVGGISMQMWT